MGHETAKTPPLQTATSSAADPTAELARRWRSGDSSALETVAARYCGPLLSYVIAMVHQLHDAEDIVQETLIRAHRSISQLRDDSSLWSWLKKIAYNLTVDFIKRNVREISVDFNTIQHPAAPGGPDRGLALQEIVKHIELLPEIYRRTAIHYYLDEWPYSKIAETLGIEPATVRQRISRINRTLRESLGRKQS